MNEEWRNELITKGAAFDALTEIESHYEFEDGHDHLMSWAKTKIFALPSAQPQHEVRFVDADHVWIDGKQYISLQRFGKAVKDAQPEWIPVTKEEMFKAGYEGREIRFRVDGRLFAIRELAQ